LGWNINKKFHPIERLLGDPIAAIAPKVTVPATTPDPNFALFTEKGSISYSDIDTTGGDVYGFGWLNYTKSKGDSLGNLGEISFVVGEDNPYSGHNHFWVRKDAKMNTRLISGAFKAFRPTEVSEEKLLSLKGEKMFFWMRCQNIVPGAPDILEGQYDYVTEIALYTIGQY